MRQYKPQLLMYSPWSFQPSRELTPVQDKKNIAENIEQQARFASALFIWTDCDREGEHIGGEIRDAARRGKPNIETKRARFSNIERAYADSSFMEQRRN